MRWAKNREIDNNQIGIFIAKYYNNQLTFWLQLLKTLPFCLYPTKFLLFQETFPTVLELGSVAYNAKLNNDDGLRNMKYDDSFGREQRLLAQSVRTI